MRDRKYIFAGWSMAVVAIAGASIAFPAIADRAAGQREGVVWQVKAEAFHADLATATTSTHASYLTDIFTDEALEVATKRDAQRVAALMKADGELRQVAKSEMQEYRCLSEALYYEARSETRSGQLGVAEVIHNRVRSKHFPNTICGVVYQGAERSTGCQFSFTCDGSTDKTPRGRAWGQAKQIARTSMVQSEHSLTGRATHYHTTEVSPVWAPKLKYTKQIGSHKFYKFKFQERPVAPSASLAVAPPA